MEKWKGKIAVVTGASSGIGAAIAQALVKKGMVVVGLARRIDRIRDLSEKLQNELIIGGRLYAFKADITNENDIIKAFKWINENLGPVHVLVNNAGIVRLGNVTNISATNIREIFETNFIGLCIATQQAFKQMKANYIDDGHIIQINSVSGHRVQYIPDANVYPASKFAVTAFTESMRLELLQLGSKIRITDISPGAVRTEIRDDQELSVEMKERVQNLPMLETQDIADAVVYALSTPSHVQIQQMILQPVGEMY